MTIFALFLCAQMSGQCQMMGTPFETLAKCQDYASQAPHPWGAVIVPHIPIPKDGRIPFAGRKDMWYECRHRHIETWER